MINLSFTAEVKEEISKLKNMDAENISELSGFLSCFYEIDYFKVVTESGGVCRRIYKLLNTELSVHPKISLKRGYNYSKKLLYFLEFKSNNEILKSLGITDTIEEFIIADEDLKKAFLRGLFMACGSVNDPKKSRYHLEFNLKSYEFSELVNILLNDFNLNSKILNRNNKYMVYIKEAEKIGDFLRIIGASRAVLYYEDIRIYRDHKNMINRLNNCEQANVDRMVMSANNLIKDIKFIENSSGLELLGEKEMEMAKYRVKYPDASLTELSEIISLETGSKITKSGLYHRFNKIKKFADKLRK